MSYVHSITIRPSSFTGVYTERLFRYFVKKKYQFYIGLERGSESEISHLQCYISCNTNASNVRRDLKKLYDTTLSENDKLFDVWLKVTKHKRPKYLLGYVQKEGVSFKTNISITDLSSSLIYYNEQKNIFLKKQTYKFNWQCKSINYLFPFIYEYASVDPHYIPEQPSEYSFPLQKLIKSAHTNELLPLSLALKYRETFEPLYYDWAKNKTYS